MATFIGTSVDEMITPTVVSTTVTGTAPTPGAGIDNLFGGDGDDTLNGGSGNDFLYGGVGNDSIYMGVGFDRAFGGDGIDMLDTRLYDGDYEVNLDTGLTNFAGEIALGFENIVSGDGNDVLTGTNGDNLMDGGVGDDTIFSGGGNDTIAFGTGIDFVSGGTGIDWLDLTSVDSGFEINLETGDTGIPGRSAFDFENIITGDGNDSVTDTLGANVIVTGLGDDTIISRSGQDSIYAGGGNDDVSWGFEPGVIDGGSGIDTLSWSSTTSVSCLLETGFISVFGATMVGFENIASGSGNDSLVGTTGNTDISGSLGDDIIKGNGGQDTLYGDDGNDKITFTADQRVYGGRGVDTVDARFLDRDLTLSLVFGFTGFASETVLDFENISSGNRNDSLRGTDGANRMYGGAGNDSIFGEGGNDTLRGDEGNDLIYFDPNAMTYGGNGVDTVDTSHFTLNIFLDLGTGDVGAPGQTAQEFENAISGIGDDTIAGSSNANSIMGGDGDDYILLSVDLNTADGGAGADDLYTTDVNSDYLINLATGMTDFGEVVTSFESVYTGDGNDHLTGTDRANTLSSSDGTDTLFCGAGRDNLIAGAGADILYGGRGADVLVGGMDHDIFVFSDDDRSFGSTRDRLDNNGTKAFQGAGGALGDLIDLSGIDANKAKAGDQAFVLAGTGRGHLSIVDDGNRTIIRGNTDRDIAFEFELVIKDGAVLASFYSAADFIL